MKKSFLFYIILLFTLLLISCDSAQTKVYNIVINDIENVLSNNDKSKLQAIKIPAGYKFVLETIDDVEKGELSNYAKKRRKYYTTQYKNKISQLIIIIYIKDLGFITTSIPDNAQNFIDSTAQLDYYNYQAVRNNDDIITMVNFISERMKEFDLLSQFKKSTLGNSFLSSSDSFFLASVPSNSIMYKIVFYIPTHFAAFLFHHLNASLYLCLSILIALTIVLKFLLRKYFLIFTLFYVLIICTFASFCVITTPRMEYVYLFNSYGFNPEFVNTITDYFSHYNSKFNDVEIYFWIFMFIAAIILNPNDIVLGFCIPEYQQHYNKNKSDWDKYAIEERPYTVTVLRNITIRLLILVVSIPAYLLLVVNKTILLLSSAMLLSYIIISLLDMGWQWKYHKALGGFDSHTFSELHSQP